MPQRAAIVTGGSSGIGFAIARMLLEEGHGVTLASRRPDKLEAAAAELSGLGEVVAVAANMADEDAVRQVVEAHRARFGAWTCWSTTPASESGRPWPRSRPGAWTCSWR